jgi:hypothetical protein
MTETTICPACLTLSETKSRPIARVVWSAVAVVFFALGVLAAPFLLVFALLAAAAAFLAKTKRTCEACGGAAIPVSTPGVQELWAKLKAKRKPQN